MKEFICHLNYRNDLYPESFILWLEIIDLDTKSNKIATKADISDIIKNIILNNLKFMSIDFYLLNFDRKNILSNFIKFYPTISNEEIINNTSLNKQYIDCLIIPFHKFIEFEKKILQKIKDIIFSNSYIFFKSFYSFSLQILNKGNYFPGIISRLDIDNDSNYKNNTPLSLFYPMIAEYKTQFDFFYKNVPQISLFCSQTLQLDNKIFINQLCLKIINNFIVQKISTDTVKKIAKLKNSFFIPQKSKYQLDNYIINEWESLVGQIFSNYNLTLIFRNNKKKNLWSIRYIITNKLNKTMLYPSKFLFDKKNNSLAIIQTAYIDQLIQAAGISQYIKDSFLSKNPLGVNITENELLNFLKNDALKLIKAGVIIKYPNFWKKIKKVFAKVNFEEFSTKTAYISKGFLSTDSIMKFSWELKAGDITIDKKIIEENIAAGNNFILINNTYVELDKEKISKIISYLNDEEEKNQAGLSFFNSLNYSIDDIKTPLIQIDKTNIFNSILSKIKKNGTNNSIYKPIKKVQNFHGKLRHYQLSGVNFLNFLNEKSFGAILADDMGLGKTIQILALILSNPKRCPTLIIAPITIIFNWNLEIKKFAPKLKTYIHYGSKREKSLSEVFEKYDIILCSYGVLKRDLTLFRKYKFPLMVIDEAQNIKNPDSEQTKSVKLIVAEHKIALTGTPIENRLIELWSIMDFCNPGLLLEANDFIKRYEIPIMKNGEENKKSLLREIIAPFMIRRLKTDKKIINDLPQKQESKIYLNLTDEQISLYDNEIKNIEKRLKEKDDLGNSKKGIMLATITKLKQICNHPANFTKSKLISKSNQSSKLDRLTNMIETISEEGNKTLIFTQFVDMGNILSSHLENILDKKILFFNGKLSLKQREKMIFEFENNSELPILILSLRAGGTGLNLTSANYVIHYDRWWNPAVENQAVDRAYRIGQKKNVFVYKYICKNTLEEKIDLLIENKLALSNDIIPKSNNIISNLNDEDFLKLIKRD